MGMVGWTASVMLYVAKPVLRHVRWWWDLAVKMVFGILVGWKSRPLLPPVFNPVLLLSATQLAEDIRSRKRTSMEVVRAYISRISDVNPLLNAMAQVDFQRALQEARKVDEKMEKGYRDGSLTPEILKSRQPFLGVPFTAKEAIAISGLPHSFGLICRAKHISSTDAEVVALIKKAGGICLGSTNVSELCLWWESYNPVYGRTNNPYDLRRTPGGSSGGEAALMAACGTPLSLGSDVGGSIRIPAFFCGLFGHKPSAGIVPIKGCKLFEEPGIGMGRMFVAGPLTRHAHDLAPILAVLATEHARSLKLGQSVNIGRLTIYTMEGDVDDLLTSKLSKELVKAQQRAVDYLQNTFEATVKKVQIPGMRKAYKIFKEKLEEEFPNMPPVSKQLADNKGEINVWTEITRFLLRRGHHTAPILLQAALEKVLEEVSFLQHQRKVFTGRDFSPASPVTSSKEPQWKVLKKQLQRLLGSDGILLYPSHPSTAPYHNEPLFRPFNFLHCGIFNALGLPVTQVPLGLSSTGMPLGVQVVGNMFQDNQTIAVAVALEKAFGGWVCPSQIL
ncbi:fatty-acid amide hydrolase 2-like [Oratosquilla oratoria]|uniref:fatty-acid amide hydrolase 2-like n=1 Tax=Oratosquilla oratoria TaxID=337810 RepID=UPI003F775100